MGGGVQFPEDPDFIAAGRRSSQAIGGDRRPCSQTMGDSVLGSVPSRFEVEKAIIDLQR